MAASGMVSRRWKGASFIMRFRTEGCTAVITGASSGLGVEFARRLAPHAAALVLAARRQEQLMQVRDDLLRQWPNLRVTVVPADVATDSGRASITEAAVREGANLLINNAGLGDYGTVLSASPERLRQQIEVNITAVVLLTHAVAPRLQRSPEAPAGILNVSSLAATTPLPDFAVYAASKAFVTSFSEALRVELLEEHIVVSYVCPGPTPTQFGQTARRSGGPDTDRGGQDLLRIPPERVVDLALQALQEGRACVFPGLGVSFAGPLFRVMPRFIMRAILQRRFARRAGT
jgi:short-subunit dehydrogenase